MKSISKQILLVITCLFLAVGSFAQTQAEQLRQMVAQLQTTPNDNALREKIIKLGAEMKPPPAIPEEANRAFVKGGVFQKEAKNIADYDLAVSAYRDALKAAPWWGDAYFNLGVAMTSANKFDAAITSFKLFIASVPVGSPEARDAQNRIYAVEAKKEMGSTRALQDTEREQTLPSVEGVWTNGYNSFQVVRVGTLFTVIKGTFKITTQNSWHATNIVADNQHLQFKIVADDPRVVGINLSYNFQLSQDGSRLIIQPLVSGALPYVRIR